MKARRIKANEDALELKGPPHAILAFAAGPYDALRWELEEDEDDLDTFQYAYFLVDDDIFVEVVRYNGNPPYTYTISVDTAATDNPEAAARYVLTECLEMPESVIDWIRP